MPHTPIKDFIAAVERLENYSFVTTVINTQTGWMGTFGNTERMEQILIGPSREEIDATLLVVRQLIQNNDSISMANVADYAKQVLTDSANDTLQQIRDSLNKELDSYPGIGVEGMTMSYRSILNTYIYGEHAHTSAKERQKYLDLQKSPVAELFTHYFYVAVRAIAVYAIYFKRLLSDESSYETV
jgi:hypothetical protein